METLYQVIYTSYVAPATEQNDVRQIVQAARESNQRLQITGLLIFDGLRICQYLEGPSQALYPLLDRVRIDSRHIEFDVKEHRHTSALRRFQDCPLAFAMLDGSQSLDRFHKFDRQAKLSAIGLLETFVNSLEIEPR